MNTLVVLNPHAASGQAGKLWPQIEPLLRQAFGDLVVAITQTPQEVAAHLEKARTTGPARLISIGGDGTNHSVINALIALKQEHPDGPPMSFGCLPMGTGHDWTRMLGTPLDAADAIQWLKDALPVPLDVGCMEQGSQHENFLNIASVGISGMVVERVNKIRQRRPWTFYQATVESLLKYRPPSIRIHLDGALWYDGPAYLVAVANGQNFGRGMRIAPNARYDDGLFDVVMVEGMPRTRILAALNTIYSGAHLKRGDVHSARAKIVEIECPDGPLGMELDGEPVSAQSMRFAIKPGILTMLARSENGKQA